MGNTDKEVGNRANVLVFRKMVDDLVGWHVQATTEQQDKLVAATTPFEANTEFAHFRRSFLRTMNSLNRKVLHE